jgi:hypothetical protein
MKAGFLAFLAVISVVGCAREQPEMSWVRTDGRSMQAEKALRPELDIALTICDGEAAKASLSGVTISGGGLAGVAASMDRYAASDTVHRGCMASRGFVLVPRSEADVVLEGFRKTVAKQPPATRGAR